MIINKLIIETLKSLNIPVAFQIYKGSNNVYITFFEYLQQGEDFSEDEEENIGHYIQLDLWSESDYTDLVKQVKSLMKDAGFKRTSENGLYESDTGIHHYVIRFFYLEECLE